MSRRDQYTAVGIFIGAFALYFLTLCRAVPGGDSGELITVAAGLGVAHPPGYPLYTLLGKLMSLVPIGSVAARVNAFSAVCNAGAAVVLFFLAQAWTRSFAGALLSAGLFAFSPLVWRYSVVAEVFALNNLLVCLFLYCVYLGRIRWVAFLAGLCLANHHTSVFYLAPIGLWLLAHLKKDQRSPQELARLIGFFALGLLPYLYLPWASSRFLPYSWGDLTTFKGFTDHLFRREYGTFQLASTGTSEPYPIKLWIYLRDLQRELLWGGVALAVLGVWGAVKKEGRRGFAVITLVAFGLYVLVFHFLSNLALANPLYYEIHSRFWMQSNLMVFLWCGAGYAALSKIIFKRSEVALIAAIGLIALQAGLNYKSEDQSQQRNAELFARSVLDSLPKDSLFLGMGDLSYGPVHYLQSIEGYRRDVKVLHLKLLEKSWINRVIAKNYPRVQYSFAPGAYSLRGFLDQNINRQAVFGTQTSTGTTDRGWESDYTVWFYGFVQRYVSRDDPDFSIDRYRKDSAHVSKLLKSAVFQPAQSGSWEYTLWRGWLDRDDMRGRIVLRNALNARSESLMRVAAEILEEAAREHPDPQAHLYFYLGFAYSGLKNRTPDEQAKMHEALTRFLKMAPADHPDRQRAMALIKRG